MLTSVCSINYVVLLCNHISLMKVFYEKTLGFTIHGGGDEWVEFKIGETFLTLRPRGRWYDGEIKNDAAKVQLAFRVEAQEVEKCYQELTEKKVEILETPTDHVYGHRTLFFRDPENNILEIYADVNYDSL